MAATREDGAWKVDITTAPLSGSDAPTAACALDEVRADTAVRQYRADEGHYPKRLADLVPDYLSETPKGVRLQGYSLGFVGDCA